MANQNAADLSLASFYEGWEAFNRLLVTAVAPLSPDQLALRMAPGQRTIAELAAHIVSARATWFHGMLGEGESSIEQFYPWDAENPPTLNAAHLEIGLETTWRLIADTLARWAPADIHGAFTTPSGHLRTRQWAVWHVIEHDLFHGGELSLTLGSHGLPGLDL